MRSVLLGLVLVVGLLAAAGTVRAADAMDPELSAMVEADADLRQAQGEATIVFTPSENADSEAEGENDADADAEADEDESEGEDEADSDAEGEAEDSSAEEGSDEVEDGTLLLSEAEQTAFAEVVMAAVDDASDAATESADAKADSESLTDAETAAATMRFAAARSKLAVRAQREFESVAKAAIEAAKSASKAGEVDAESLSLAVAKHMGDGLLKTVGTGLAHKLGAGLSEKIGAWQEQLKQLSAAQHEAEAGSKHSKKKSAAGSMRFASAKAKAKGKDPRWFPPPLPVSATDSMRNEPMDITAVAPQFKSDKTPEDVEDCVSCRYVWLQVEQDVGNSAIEETVYDSFFQNALEAQKTPIFYPGCQTMFDQVDDMLGDYMDGYSVDQMCENAMLCR